MISVESILREASAYNGTDVKRINHFLKVYAFAKMIGEGEHLSGQEQYVLEIAAVLHDIGIQECEKKYKSTAGKYQELEGPPIARKLLEQLCVDSETVDRVCYLVGHHHTYDQVDGIDYQILIEADFFVNADEDHMDIAAMKSVYDRIFQTKTGKELFRKMYFEA